MAESPISKEYSESVCEIKSIDNSLVAVGKIKEVSDEVIKIYNGKKELRVLNYGERLKINIFNTKLGFKVIEGTVFTSSKAELSLAEISILADKERRHFFRVDMELDAIVIYRDRGPSHEIGVTVLDMSLSGLRFKADHEFSEGDIISVAVNISANNKSKTEIMPCRIVRVIEHRRKNELQYGCEFIGEEASDNLCSFLFKKQREFLNSRKNGSMY